LGVVKRAFRVPGGQSTDFSRVVLTVTARLRLKSVFQRLWLSFALPD